MYKFIENPIEKDAKIGEVIAAKEKNGSKFYRAEVISKIDNEHFSVCFIDFGSRDIVHKKNIVRPSESQVKIIKMCKYIYIIYIWYFLQLKKKKIM